MAARMRMEQPQSQTGSDAGDLLGMLLSYVIPTDQTSQFKVEL